MLNIINPNIKVDKNNEEKGELKLPLNIYTLINNNSRLVQFCNFCKDLRSFSIEKDYVCCITCNRGYDVK